MAEESSPRLRRLEKPTAPATTRAFVFVISQIGDKGSPERTRADEVLEHIVEPVAEQFELDALRSDLDPTPGQLTTQIIKGIINARVVIADLTGRNANVFFELGVAQSFAKPLILLVKETGSLPFDVKGERTIEIGDGDVLGVSQAKDAAKLLKAAMEVVLEPGYEPTNLVTEVAAARSLDAMAPENPIASELSALREMLEAVHVTTSQTLRRMPTPGRTADLTAMRRFVENLVESDLFVPAQLEDLATENTSPGFDSWVRKMVDRAQEVEQHFQRIHSAPRSDQEEEPF